MINHKNKIRAVIFDMDGVLIDSEMIYLEIRHRFALRKNPAIKIEDLYPMVGHIAKHSWSIMEKLVNNGQSWEELRSEYLEATSEDYDSIDFRRAFRPEAADVLETLKQRGYRMAVASSNHLPMIRNILEVNGIIGYFETVVSGEQFKQSKPSPEIYQFTAGKMQLSTWECFALEDSTAGITSAHRAGMTVAALVDERFGFDRTLADLEANSISGILQYLP